MKKYLILLSTLTLVHLQAQSQETYPGRASHIFKTNLQNLNSSIQWAGEIPPQYMQSTNKESLEEMKQSLEAYIAGTPDADLSDILNHNDARIFLKIINESIDFSERIDRKWLKQEKPIPIEQAASYMYSEQIRHRRTLIKYFTELLEQRYVSQKIFSTFLIYYWDALAKPPRVAPSPEYIANMKEELKDWLPLSRSILRKTGGDPKLQTLAYQAFFNMLNKNLSQTSIYQLELLNMMNELSPETLSSVWNFAIVKKLIEQQNLSVTDPMNSIQIEKLFPKEVRKTYAELSRLQSLEYATDYLQLSKTESFPEFLESIHQLLQPKNGHQQAAIDQFTIESSENLRVTDTKYLVSLWNPDSLSKPYYQLLGLVRDFVILSTRVENPLIMESNSTNPYNPASVLRSDFLYLDKIIDGLQSSILDNSLPPQVSDVLAKILSELVPMTVDLNGLDSKSNEALISAFAKFRIKRPHDNNLTQLAESLFRDSTGSPVLRLMGLQYYQNSVFGNDSLPPLDLAIQNSLIESVKQQQKNWHVIKEPYSDSGYIAHNRETPEGERSGLEYIYLLNLSMPSSTTLTKLSCKSIFK